MYRPDDDGKLGGLWVLAVLTLGVLAIVFLTGCAARQKAGLGELPEEDKLPAYKWRTKWETKIEKVYETNWLAAVFICGVAASIFMIVQGVKAGWGVLAASAGGLIFMRLDQTLVEQVWPYLIGGCFLLAGLGWYVWRTFVSKRAFSEVVAGGERLKQFFPVGKGAFKKSYAGKENGGVQSKATQKLVAKERVNSK